MKSYPYQILGNGEREESLFFMLNALLHSRIETGEETTDDEDVNIYLANLLHDFMGHDFENASGDMVSCYEMDVSASIEQQTSLGMHFHIYRSNADYALMKTSIFDALADSRGPVEQDEEFLVARGKTYYRYASSCHERFKHKRTGVAEVMQKLSDRFEMYMTILIHMRVSYFNLLKRLSQGEVFHIQRKAQESPEFENIQQGRDQFLDAYSDWMRTGAEYYRQRINALGQALVAVDKKFKFEGV
jgi:hypothetical protein